MPVQTPKSSPTYSTEPAHCPEAASAAPTKSRPAKIGLRALGCGVQHRSSVSCTPHLSTKPRTLVPVTRRPHHRPHPEPSSQERLKTNTANSDRSLNNETRVWGRVPYSSVKEPQGIM